MPAAPSERDTAGAPTGSSSGVASGFYKALARIIVPYVAVAALWIWLSDWVLQMLFASDATLMTRWATYKGLAFIAVTALLLYLLLRRELGARWRAEVTVRQQQELLAAVTEGTSDVVFVKDLGGRYLSVNKSLLRMVGMARADVLGQTDLVVFPPEEARRMIEADRRIIDSGVTQTYEESIAIGGHKIFFHTAKGPVRDAQNRITGLFGISRNITELKHAQADLRRSEARFRRMAENIDDVLYGVDGSTGEFEYLSPAFERMFGYTHDDVRRMGGRRRFLAQVVLDGSFGEQDAVFGRMQDGSVMDSPMQWLSRWRCKDGREKFIEDRWIPIHDEDRLRSTFGVLRDVTERRQVEATLHALVGKLQGVREEERTRIAGEVHDVLGQSLTGMKMDLAWLGRKAAQIGDPAMRAQLAAKQAEIEALADTMIETVQRISAELRPSVLDNIGLPAAVHFESKRWSERAGLACEVVVPEDDLPLDPETVTAAFRILQELLTNVARHAGARRVAITLAWIVDHLRLEVRDDGRGAGELELSGPKSLGILGMRERAARLGGSLDLRGEPGRGTTAVLTLPLRKAGV